MARKALHLGISFAVVGLAISSTLLPSDSSILTTIVVFNATEPETGKWRALTTYSNPEDVERFSKSLAFNISGLVQLAATTDGDNCGCQDPYNHVDVKSGPWIALAERGQCTFMQKVSKAASANASGIIVYDSLNNPTMMSHENKDGIIGINIPRYLGLEAVQRIKQGDIVTVQISLGRLFLNSYARGNKTSIIFVSLSFLILMVISLAWVIVYYAQRFRIMRSSRLLKRLDMPRKFIVNLPQKTLEEGDEELENEEICPICIETYKAEDVLRILPCQHLFHCKCVDSWFKLKETCPMCKYDLLKSASLLASSSEINFVPRSPPVVEVWEPEVIQRSGNVTPTSTDSLVPSTQGAPVVVEHEVPEAPNTSGQDDTDATTLDVSVLAATGDGSGAVPQD